MMPDEFSGLAHQVPGAEFFDNFGHVSEFTLQHRQAIKYFDKALDEYDRPLRMFLFILACESLEVGQKGDIRSLAYKNYRALTSGTQHEVLNRLNIPWFKDYRDRFAHHAEGIEYSGFEERLIQSIFIDLFLFSLTGTNSQFALSIRRET